MEKNLVKLHWFFSKIRRNIALQRIIIRFLIFGQKQSFVTVCNIYEDLISILVYFYRATVIQRSV